MRIERAAGGFRPDITLVDTARRGRMSDAELRARLSHDARASLGRLVGVLDRLTGDD